MTGILNALIAGVSGAVKDTYFNLVSLLLPGNGTNGATNNSFVDSSTANSGTGWPITRNGDTTQGTFSPFSQTGWGNRFDGATSTRLTLASGTDFAFGTGAYTMEAWVYLTAYSSAGNVIFDCGSATGSIGLSVTSTGEAQLNKYGTGAIVITAASAVPLNAWTHIAVTRVSTSTNETRIFINGSLSQTGTDNNNWTVTTTPSIGGYGLANYTVNGFISNLSVLKGTAKYTSAFTPATTPLPTNTANQVLLACQANRFIDANTATTAKTLTVNGSPSVTPFSPFAPTSSYSAAAVGGSGYFDGSGDYLSVADNAALELGSSSFCTEVLFYPTVLPSTGVALFSKQPNPSTDYGFRVLSINSVVTVYISSGNTSDDIANGTLGTLRLNAWNHIAIYRVGTAVYGSLNGTITTLNANTSLSVWNNTASWVIGASSTGTSGATGYFSDWRIVIGSGVYTSSSAPFPTAPLTAITNTSLLLNFTNAGVVDATAKNVLETEGNAQISTAQSKWGGGSMYFPQSGTTDILKAQSNSGPSAMSMMFGTGPYTIEMWVYQTARNVSYGAYLISNQVFQANITGTGTVNANKAGGADYATTTTTVALNTWTHIAFVRTSTASNGFKIYINGVDSATGTDSTDYSSATQLNIATTASGGANYVFTGYIDDLRITRYARTITLPTAPFPLQ